MDYKYRKLNDYEIENLLIEIPGDDGGLTDLKDEIDDDCVEEKNYLDLLDTNTNVETTVLNIMDK